LIVCGYSSLLTLRRGLFEGERHPGRSKCLRQRMSSAISSRSRRTPRPVQIHAVRSKRTGDGYSWPKCRRCINSTCISLCHEFSSGFSCEDRRCSRKDAESMCHVYFTIVFIIVDSSKNTYFATSGKVLCFIKGCFFCSNHVIQIQCFCPILELQLV